MYGTDIIGHDMQWFLLFMGTHTVPSLSHGDSCGLSMQCSKELAYNSHEVCTSGHPPHPVNDDAIQLLSSL